MSPYFIKTILTSIGERLPVLISRPSGMPLFDVAVWTVSELRGRHVASNTILQALRSLVFLFIVLDRKKIDLSQRLNESRFLDKSEIEEIITACSSTLESILNTQNKPEPRQRKVTSLEKVRMSMTRNKRATDVEPGTISIRLNYIREFLIWSLNTAILKATVSTRSDLLNLREITEKIFTNKIPHPTGRNHIYQRMGLPAESQDLLLLAVDPASPGNPWGTAHTKIRNALIVRCLLSLGIRRSELLGIRIRDIDIQGQSIKILRRPDDKYDPRLYEPNAKTRDRLLPLQNDLFQQIRNYLSVRRKIIGARQHDFLLVANGSGSPLSISELNRLFQPLQKMEPEFFYLSPHVLRHTFFENLCEDFDRNRVPVEEWEPMLRRLGGWGDTSSTSQRYTKRYTQRRANEAMLSMQQRLNMNGKRYE